jgi:hypothetical protein
MGSIRRSDAIFGVAAVVAAIAILGLGAGLTFWSDEWALIEGRSLTDPATWLAPHNEHWTTLATLIYRVLVETVGLRSYVPYQVVLIGFHIMAAACLFVLIRRSAGEVPAIASAVVFLLFGSGFENLYWAFQLTFVGSFALGLAAMLAFDRRTLTPRWMALGAGLLMASMAMSGIGLICLAAIAVELLLDAERRRGLVALAVPVAGYAVWYLAFGRFGVEAHQGVFRLGGLTDVPPVILGGLAAAAGAITGTGRAVGGLVFLVGLLVLAWAAVRRRGPSIAPRAVGCLAAIVALYGLIALSRSFVGPDVVDYTRYTYESAPLLAIGLAAQVGHVRPETVGQRRVALFVGGLVLVLALGWNIQLLIAGRALFQERAERTRALITVALERPLPPTTDPSRTLVLVPSPMSLERITTQYGSPLTDALVPWAVRPIAPAVLADARRVLAEGAEIPLPKEPRAP